MAMSKRPRLTGLNRHQRPGVFSEHVRGETAADVDGSTERRDAAARPEDRIAVSTLGSRAEEWRGAKHADLDRDNFPECSLETSGVALE